ncbi:unnamed protein product [Euphydryas editha]|uniref:Uncharacterized protein n=1 Tax=Euphydryas editha TaxID=104508 RepID=A0AAU9TSQ7_EUPED|nr:unnamed protein product [Euphydryas editha]
MNKQKDENEEINQRCIVTYLDGKTYHCEGSEGAPAERIGQSPEEGARGLPLAHHHGFTHGWWVTGLATTLFRTINKLQGSRALSPT